MTFSKVVIGEIKECTQHPEADRLRICMVDVAEEELLQVVCGAPNARVGLRTACALVGAELPPAPDSDKPFKIKKGKLRGVVSLGMLCSSEELGLPIDDIFGIMEIDSKLPNGTDLKLFLKEQEEEQA